MTTTDTHGDGLDPKALDAFERLLTYGRRPEGAGTTFRFNDGGAFFLSDIDANAIRAALRSPFGSDTAGLPADRAGLVEQTLEMADTLENKPWIAVGRENVTRALRKAAEAIAALSRAPEAVASMEDEFFYDPRTGRVAGDLLPTTQPIGSDACLDGRAVEQLVEYMGDLLAGAMSDIETANPADVSMDGTSIIAWRKAYLEGCKDMAEGILSRFPEPIQKEAVATVKSAVAARPKSGSDTDA